VTNPEEVSPKSGLPEKPLELKAPPSYLTDRCLVLALRDKGALMMMNKVVASLRKEYSRLETEIGRVGKALDALGHASGKTLRKTGRALSKDARRRIAEAQKLRWAKVRKQAAKLVKS
jgi:hypothetical protein